MKHLPEKVDNRVKQYRVKAGLSQSALAELVGIKRQGIYDIESGRYLPNTGVALKLARHLGCRVEDLFYETVSETDLPVVMGEEGLPDDGRVSVVKIRDRLVVYPVDGRFTFPSLLQPADGVFRQKKADPVFSPESSLDQIILITGCDPAFHSCPHMPPG